VIVQVLRTYELCFQKSKHRYDLNQGSLNELNSQNLNLPNVPNGYQLDLIVLKTKIKYSLLLKLLEVS